MINISFFELNETAFIFGNICTKYLRFPNDCLYIFLNIDNNFKYRFKLINHFFRICDKE